MFGISRSTLPLYDDQWDNGVTTAPMTARDGVGALVELGRSLRPLRRVTYVREVPTGLRGAALGVLRVALRRSLLSSGDESGLNPSGNRLQDRLNTAAGRRARLNDFGATNRQQRRGRCRAATTGFRATEPRARLVRDCNRTTRCSTCGTNKRTRPAPWRGQWRSRVLQLQRGGIDVGEEGWKPTGKCQANPLRVVFVRSLWGSRRPRPARPKGARRVARRRVIQTIDVGAAQHRWTPRELGGGPRKMCGNHAGLR